MKLILIHFERQTKITKNYIGFVIVLTILSSCNNTTTSETPTEEVTRQTPTEEVAKETTNTNETSETSNVLSEIKIGNQIWSTKNLEVSTFRNGDLIPEIKDPEEWEKACHNQQPAWCYYDNKPENGKIYGKLYNWYAVIDARRLEPEGWHVPFMQEWNELIDTLGGSRWAGAKLKSNMGWRNSITSNGKGNGTNSSGFTGNPGGFRSSGDKFRGSTIYGKWWLVKYNDYQDKNEAWCFELSNDATDNNVSSYSLNSIVAFSVRCIKD